jgi:uracil-DNA glycosylase
MSDLAALLESVTSCNSCHLMIENNFKKIPYIPILPKPAAKFMFIGRDPSPNTAEIVGVRGGRSVFINEIFRISDEAGLSDDEIYITDLCKCHWRTSVGTPFPGTEGRKTKLDKDVAHTCFNTWLVRELDILNPELVIAFGEELYQLILPVITTPKTPPKKLSVSRDKLKMDAEKWYAENGPMIIEVSGKKWPLAVLRHPGNISRLPRAAENDHRMKYHQLATGRTIEYLSNWNT